MGQDAQPLQPIVFAAEQSPPAAACEFPERHHLLLTTENQVLCLDASGLSHIFTSSFNGILAAKEAKGGRGTLAIADGEVVLLHSLERGDRSNTLKRTDIWLSLTGFEYFTRHKMLTSNSKGQIRLLQHSPQDDILR